jgi:hypothetical protein
MRREGKRIRRRRMSPPPLSGGGGKKKILSLSPKGKGKEEE